MVVKNGNDHHSTQQICMLSKELLAPFICDCQTNGVKTSSENYLEWINETCSEHYYHLKY